MNPIAIAIITLGSGVGLFALGTSKASALQRLIDQKPPKTPPKVPIRALPAATRPPSSAPRPIAKPAVTAKPAPPKPPPAPSASSAAKPATKLPAKRPFGDQPLDVQADDSNYIPEHRAELSDAAPANAIPASAVAKPTTTRAPSQAARELYDYVVPLIRDGRGDVLGTKGAPNAIVKAAQRDMKITADGIYGDKTRARGKELLGREFPPRAGTKIKAATPASAPITKPAAPAPPAPPPPASPPAITNVAPATRDPVSAARFLFDYATEKLRAGQGEALGVKGKPSEPVRAAQRDMGGLTADGMYGPATRERGKKLLNKTFPARV